MCSHEYIVQLQISVVKKFCELHILNYENFFTKCIVHSLWMKKFVCDNFWDNLQKFYHFQAKQYESRKFKTIEIWSYMVPIGPVFDAMFF